MIQLTAEQRREVVCAIKEFIAVHNKDPKPFVWTAKADDILQKVIRANRRLSSRRNEALHRYRNGSDSFRTCATSDVRENRFAGDDVTGQGQVLGRKSQREADFDHCSILIINDLQRLPISKSICSSHNHGTPNLMWSQNKEDCLFFGHFMRRHFMRRQRPRASTRSA